MMNLVKMSMIEIETEAADLGLIQHHITHLTTSQSELRLECNTDLLMLLRCSIEDQMKWHEQIRTQWDTDTDNAGFQHNSD